MYLILPVHGWSKCEVASETGGKIEKQSGSLKRECEYPRALSFQTLLSQKNGSRYRDVVILNSGIGLCYGGKSLFRVAP